jgi:hypothetical protein
MSINSEKIMSGRLWMTIGATVSLILMVWSDCKIAMLNPTAAVPFPPAAIFAVISAVCAFYFSRPPELPKPPTVLPSLPIETNKLPENKNDSI